MAENQTITQRINLFLSEKKIHINEFEKNILVSNGLIGKAIRENRVLGSDKIENILKSYPDINPIWLLTGKGEMLLSEEKSGEDNEGNVSQAIPLSECEKEVSHLRELLAEKERLIQVLLNKL